MSQQHSTVSREPFVGSPSLLARHNVNTKPFGTSGATTHLQVQNEMMLRVIKGSDGLENVQHIRLQNSKATDLKLPPGESMDGVAFVHMDASGTHALISTSRGDNFYVNMKTIGLRPLKRLKGMTISAVGWNYEYSKDSETGFIALGTTKGAILETNITSSSGSMNYMKTLINNMSGDNLLPISDIYMSQSEDEPDRWIMLICVPSRLYAIDGIVNLTSVTQQAQPVVGSVWSSVMMEQPQSATLQSLFNFNNTPPRYHGRDAEGGSPSALAVYPIGAMNEPVSKFCWVSVDGITMGAIDIAKAEAYEMITYQTQIKHKMFEGHIDYPVDVAITEYHALLLYRNRLIVICLLNQAAVYEDTFSMDPTRIVGMTRDTVSGMIWAFTEEHSMYKYRMNNEARNVWRIYLDQREFAKARKITSQMQDQQPYQTVIKREAEKYIAEKNYVAAAELMAQSSEPFEAIVLKFLKEGQASRNGVKRFLELKLNQMDRDKVRRDIIVTWLLDIQLGEIAELRRNSPSKDERPEEGITDKSSMPTGGLGLMADREAEIKKLREELYCFLNRAIVSESIHDNRASIYRLISSHLDFETELHLATKLKDFDIVIKILILQQNYIEALHVLTQQANSKLFYKHAPEFITKIPAECVKALIDNERLLRTVHLLPVFYKCFEISPTENPKLLAATFYYFGHVLDKQQAPLDKSIHNFVLQLYATFKPNALLEFLKKWGINRRRIPYDVQQALRMCVNKELNDCTIFLYCLADLHENAVQQALQMEKLDQAKECALDMNRVLNKMNDDFDDILLLDESPSTNITEEGRKRVWLEIAQYMIRKDQSVEACMQLLRESEGALNITDVLSYFPEFVSIEHFKEPLCAYLKDHSENTHELQREMKMATEMAAEIRANLDEKNSAEAMLVKAGDKCWKCKGGLLQCPFFAFMCHHFFHVDCLEEIVMKEFSEISYAQLKRDQKLMSKAVQLKAGSKAKELTELRNVKEKLDTLLADDCPLCGRRIIEAVDRPFFSDADYATVMSSWAFT